MSRNVKLPDGRLVSQRSGDVVVIEKNKMIVAHYGQLGWEIDAAARRSLLPNERVFTGHPTSEPRGK